MGMLDTRMLEKMVPPPLEPRAKNLCSHRPRGDSAMPDDMLDIQERMQERVQHRLGLMSASERQFLTERLVAAGQAPNYRAASQKLTYLKAGESRCGWTFVWVCCRILNLPRPRLQELEDA